MLMVPTFGCWAKRERADQQIVACDTEDCFEWLHDSLGGAGKCCEKPEKFDFGGLSAATDETGRFLRVLLRNLPSI